MILVAESEAIRVKVEIKINEAAKEPYVVIFTSEITESVRQAAAILESAAPNKRIAVTDNKRTFVLDPEELYMLRVENERTAVYTRTKRFDSGRRLYEFEDTLGVGFMRISKSVLINLQHLACVEPTLGGLMMVTLKNGCKECISRKYLPAFKKYLGL
ncbi:MAG TPA: LytTR family DNA-binding domain-containing protein [Clostridiales bacterium]|nr:LytTR family DNA-binding domain-containing protein [Clostridiales bacterium]